MDIILDTTKEKSKSKIKSLAVDVSMIAKAEMEEIKDNPPQGSIDIKMETWTETDGNTPIVNHGAAPCLIVYALNTETGHVISGHFPEYNKEKQDMFTRREIKYAQERYGLKEEPEGIVIPDEKQVDFLSYTRIDKGYEEFIKMKKRIKEWGVDKTEVYLFGNNSGAFGSTPEEYNKRVVDSVIEQQSVSIDFYKLGVPYTKQHDHRVPGQDNVDDTFYSPKDRIVKHSIREHRDDGKYWLRK